jgi:hypothetical protein
MNPEGACGVAVAIAGSVVASIDIFDKPATLQKLWDRLVLGLALDAVEVGDAERAVDGSDISVELYKTGSMRWRRVEPAIGMGEAFRAQDDGTLATALVVDGTPIHLSISAPI